MKKYSCFRFFLSAVLIPMVMACGKETSSRWEKTSEGTKLYIKDSLSTLFNKVSYTWRGDSMFGLAHGTGVLYGKDSDGETVYSREVNAWYGLIDKTDIRKMQTAVKAYCGPTKKDKPNGFGIRKEEGILYIGDFKKGKGTGDVIIMRNDGLYYAGEWEKDKIAGEGYMAAPDSSFVYEGGFRNGLFSGSGELFLINTFSDTYSMISGLGIKGGKAAVGAAAFSALVTVLDNIEQRNEQKLKIVKEQAKLISNIKEAAGEIVKSEAQILRCGEILSALYNANKAFIQAYCHLRDIVFGPISFHSYWYGIDKDNPELKTEEFISDIQHLVVVCSEYNKINQAK